MIRVVLPVLLMTAAACTGPVPSSAPAVRTAVASPSVDAPAIDLICAMDREDVCAEVATAVTTTISPDRADVRRIEITEGQFCNSQVLGPACGDLEGFVAGVLLTFADGSHRAVNAWRTTSGQIEIRESEPVVDATNKP